MQITLPGALMREVEGMFWIIVHLHRFIGDRRSTPFCCTLLLKTAEPMPSNSSLMKLLNPVISQVLSSAFRYIYIYIIVLKCSALQIGAI